MSVIVDAKDVLDQELHNKLLKAIEEISEEVGDDLDRQASIYFSLKIITKAIEAAGEFEEVEVNLG